MITNKSTSTCLKWFLEILGNSFRVTFPNLLLNVNEYATLLSLVDKNNQLMTKVIHVNF